jgi:DNA-binding CsgD family transcriptional regulator
MLREVKHIAVISPDKLRNIGLLSLLTEYFPPVSVDMWDDLADIQDRTAEAYDFFFVTAETFVLNADFFLPRKSKTIVLTDNANPSGKNPAVNNLRVTGTQEAILEQLEKLLTADNSAQTASTDNNKGLSQREIDVLQQIVTGMTNKEVADKLKISLNTVLTHRKNITAKLGIKTLSGLTFYALMNGIISGDDIEL